MDPLLILLIIVAVIAVSGWGYGTYTTRAVPVQTEVVSAPGWVSPLGILGLLAIIALAVMLFTGWRPFVVVA